MTFPRVWLRRLAVLLSLLAAVDTALAQDTPAQSRQAQLALRMVVQPSPDGSRLMPVRLDAVSVRTEIQGSEAVTEVELSFLNPNPRQLEGELQFPLLDGQGIIGMAMDVGGQLREAVPVEKARAQQVFEDVSRARIDPALLEQTQGNNYKLRVFPLLPNVPKHVVLRYAETLPVEQGELVYRLPLPYAERLASFDLDVRSYGSDTAPIASGGGLGVLNFDRRGEVCEAQVRRSQFAASGVFEARLPAPEHAAISLQDYAGKTYFQARIPVPAVAARPRALPRKPAIVWDASGSGAGRNHALEFALLDRYFKTLDNGEVSLVMLRDTASTPRVFRIVHGDWSELRQVLEATAYDGGTDLGAVPKLADAGEVLLFSDGLSNFGAPQLPQIGGPVYAISAAASADLGVLRELARRSGGRAIDLAGDTLAAAVAALLDESPTLAGVEGSGVSDLLTASAFPSRKSWTVAGILEPGAGDAVLHLRIREAGGRTRKLDLPLRTAGHGRLAAIAWARLKMASLDGEYTLNRAAIRRLGEAFGLASRETSLLILDRVEDYVRYEITPPAELQAEYERQLTVRRGAQDGERRSHLDEVLRMAREKADWWKRGFPKDLRLEKQEALKPEADAGAADWNGAEERARVSAGTTAASGQGEVLSQSSVSTPEVARDASNEPGVREFAPAASPLPPSPPREPVPAPMAVQANIAVAPAKMAPPSGESFDTIRLKAWTPDAPYRVRLHQASADELYRVYLDERPGWINSSAFFLDAADEFFARGQRQLGLRVLSNLAEMNLENRALLRILGYRLLQADALALALPVFERVRVLAPEEPQSWRDLGLACEAAGEDQKAIDNLYEVVMRRWDGRFPQVELIALAELNAIVARNHGLDTSHIDPRLLADMPLDLRVVLTWDADNTDIDLWVTDPSGEKAFYGHPLSRQGGRMSNDFTQGYGPEEFSLKTAMPGTYKVQVNFYGNRQQVIAGATTVQVKLITHFGTPRQQEQPITLRLGTTGEVVDVGEFQIKQR